MNSTAPKSLLPLAGEGWMRVFLFLLATPSLYKRKTLTPPSPASGRGNAAQ
jgi:hypothetical protein